jgi:hypothetical protein
MADAPANPLAAATASFGDTAKWIVGGVTASIGGVMVGAPLTHLGDLEGDRLRLAVAGSAVALVALAAILLIALGVISAKLFTVRQLSTARLWAGWRVRRIETELRGRIPAKCTTLGALVTSLDAADATSKAAKATVAATTEAVARAAAERAERTTAEAFRKLKDDEAAFEPQLAFEYKRQRFNELIWAMAALVPVAAIAIGVYAWAATPSAPTATSTSPRTADIPADAATIAALTPKVDAGCFMATPGGGATLKAVILAEYPGWSDLVAAPGPACHPVRLRQQNGRLLLPSS